MNNAEGDAQIPSDTEKPGDLPMLDGYPLLQAVLDGSMGLEVQAELRRLVTKAYPTRAPRKPVSVIGKILRTVSGCLVEETVIVHDVSETGMRITLPAHVELRLSEAIEPTFVLRLEDVLDSLHAGGEWRVHGRFARLVGSRQAGVELAYVFVGLSETERRAVHHIAQWVRPRREESERPNTGTR